jgi:hypothetical protein
MEVLNTMTKIINSLRTHGGIARVRRWVLIYRSLCDGRRRAMLPRPTRATSTEAELLCDHTGRGKQLANDNPV